MRDFLLKNSSSIVVLVGLLAATSVGYNMVQRTEINRLNTIKELVQQRESLVNDSFNEILMGRISELRENIADISRNQGKVEGMVAVSMNLNPETNHTSAIWHEGYYRGMAQTGYIEESAYIAGYHRATEDMNCPASVKEKMNADAPRKYEQDKKIDIENLEFNKALDEAEKRRKNIDNIKKDINNNQPNPTTPEKK